MMVIADWRAYPTMLGPGGARLVEVAMAAQARTRATCDVEEIPMLELRRARSRALVTRQSQERWSRGQGLVEYVLIILFVALAVVLALSFLAPPISTILDTISSSL